MPSATAASTLCRRSSTNTVCSAGRPSRSSVCSKIPRLGLAHADLAGDHDDVEHLVPPVARVVVAPRVREQAGAQAGRAGTAYQAGHVGRVLEVAEHPVQQAVGVERSDPCASVSASARRCSKSGTVISPRSRAWIGLSRASAPYGLAQPVAHRRDVGVEVDAVGLGPALHGRAHLAGEDAAPVDDESAERTVARRSGTARPRARPARSSAGRRRRDGRRTGRRRARRASGGSSPRAGSRASTRRARRTTGCRRPPRPVASSHSATTSSRRGKPSWLVTSSASGTVSPGSGQNDSR